MSTKYADLHNEAIRRFAEGMDVPLAVITSKPCPEAEPGIDARLHEPHEWNDVEGVRWSCRGLLA